MASLTSRVSSWSSPTRAAVGRIRHAGAGPYHSAERCAASTLDVRFANPAAIDRFQVARVQERRESLDDRAAAIGLHRTCACLLREAWHCTDFAVTCFGCGARELTIVASAAKSTSSSNVCQIRSILRARASRSFVARLQGQVWIGSLDRSFHRRNAQPGEARMRRSKGPKPLRRTPLSDSPARRETPTVLNLSNRRIRTRMYGGVGGEEPRGSPLSRSQ